MLGLNLFSFFETDVLFGWSLEGEDGLLVFAGDGKVALSNDIHADDEVVILGWGEHGFDVLDYLTCG